MSYMNKGLGAGKAQQYYRQDQNSDYSDSQQYYMDQDQDGSMTSDGDSLNHIIAGNKYNMGGTQYQKNQSSTFNPNCKILSLK